MEPNLVWLLITYNQVYWILFSHVKPKTRALTPFWRLRQRLEFIFRTLCEQYLSNCVGIYPGSAFTIVPNYDSPLPFLKVTSLLSIRNSGMIIYYHKPNLMQHYFLCLRRNKCSTSTVRSKRSEFSISKEESYEHCSCYYCTCMDHGGLVLCPEFLP